ncbi:MAG: hypothetical protein GY930_12735 [bacterium]|nr:hypothetical protein [bacterium]
MAKRLLRFHAEAKSDLVTLAAISGLGLRRDPTIAVPVLIGSTQTVGKRSKKLATAFERINQQYYAIKLAEWAQGTDPNAPVVNKKKRDEWARIAEEWAPVGPEFRATQATEVAGLTALANYKEDRCTNALIQGVSGSIRNDNFAQCLQALLNNGTRPCIARGVKEMKTLDGHFHQIKKTIKKLGKERPKPVPKKWSGTKAAWKARFDMGRQDRIN